MKRLYQGSNPLPEPGSIWIADVDECYKLDESYVWIRVSAEELGEARDSVEDLQRRIEQAREDMKRTAQTFDKKDLPS